MTALALKITAFSLAMGSLAVGCSSSSAGNTGDGGGGATGALPTVSISSPAAGASVMVTTVGSVGQEVIPVTFATTGLTLMLPGGCGSVSTSCGHVHVLVDGAACTPSGQPYNDAATSAGPVNAILSSCPMVNGAHTITLELHADDHSPIKDASGKVISANVMITATGG